MLISCTNQHILHESSKDITNELRAKYAVYYDTIRYSIRKAIFCWPHEEKYQCGVIGMIKMSNTNNNYLLLRLDKNGGMLFYNDLLFFKSFAMFNSLSIELRHQRIEVPS